MPTKDPEENEECAVQNVELEVKTESLDYKKGHVNYSSGPGPSTSVTFRWSRLRHISTEVIYSTLT